LKQLTFVLTSVLYAVIANPPNANPYLARLFSICSIGLIWTSGLIWLAPIFQGLLNMGSDHRQSFWLYWGYSFPIVVGLAFIQSSRLSRGYEWK
jgi:FtsH-binding integral membrane protein